MLNLILHVDINFVHFRNRVIAVSIGGLKNSVLDLVGLVTKVFLHFLGDYSIDFEVDIVF